MLSRSRKFTPHTLFLSLVYLVSSRASEGYLSALEKAFGGINIDAPAKSSLSKYRAKISYNFFYDLLNKLLGSFDRYRPTYNGRRVYAIDGKKAYIPRSKELEKMGLVGRTLSQWRESYFLRIHITHAYDVLSGTTKAVRVGPILNEIADAISMIKKFERFSITLYDRLYLCKKLLRAHLKARNSFLMRAKKDSTLKEIINFRRSKKTTDSFMFEGYRLYLYRVKKRKKDQSDDSYGLFVSDLSPSKFSRKKVSHLYRERWEVETSFKELTESLSLEQWHSKNFNGCMQEFFTRFWLFNFTKMMIFSRGEKQKKTVGENYRKSNFKFIVEWVVLNFKEVIVLKRGVLKKLEELIKKSTEKRKRYSRSYPREIKRPSSPYKYNNTIFVINGKKV